MSKRSELFADMKRDIEYSHSHCADIGEPYVTMMLEAMDCSDDCGYPKYWFGKCMARYRGAYHRKLHREDNSE